MANPIINFIFATSALGMSVTPINQQFNLNKINNQFQLLNSNNDMIDLSETTKMSYSNIALIDLLRSFFGKDVEIHFKPVETDEDIMDVFVYNNTISEEDNYKALDSFDEFWYTYVNDSFRKYAVLLGEDYV